MGYEKDAFFVFRQFFDKVIQIFLGEDIQTIAGFVKNDNFRIADNSLSNADTLFVAF